MILLSDELWLIANNCKSFVISSLFSVDLTVTFKNNANPNKNILLFFLGLYRAVGKRRGRGGASPLPFPGANFFFPRKIRTHRIFTCEEHSDKSDKK